MFVGLVILHAERMRCVILSPVARSAVPYFPTLSYKRRDFRGEKIVQHEMCVLILLNMKCVF